MNVTRSRYGQKENGVFRAVMKDYVKYLNLTKNVKENKTVINWATVHGAGKKKEVPYVMIHLPQRHQRQHQHLNQQRPSLQRLVRVSVFYKRCVSLQHIHL